MMNRKMMRLLVGLVFLVGTLYAQATPVISFDPSGAPMAYEGGSPGGVRGWAFDVVQPGGITVTHLGVFDYGADGLVHAHDIGIWDSSGALIASGTVDAVATNPLDDNNLFRLVDIADIFLPQATGYVIGAFYSYGGDLFAQRATSAAFDGVITYADKLYISNVSSLTKPTISYEAQPGYFGPSFEFSVPEPATLALFSLGLAGLGAVRRKKLAA